MRLLLFILVSCLTFSCKQKTNPSIPLENYFNYGDSVESAGVKMIPIATPVGTFNVWTKRFGNNPKIKILLLHGGPAMTHEYMECFETFFQREGSLRKDGNDWILTVEKKAFDILLEQIPWSFRTVKLPWNKYVIHVEW